MLLARVCAPDSPEEDIPPCFRSGRTNLVCRSTSHAVSALGTPGPHAARGSLGRAGRPLVNALWAPPHHHQQKQRCQQHWPVEAHLLEGMGVAVGETVILLNTPLPLVGVSIETMMERQQNDSLANS